MQLVFVERIGAIHNKGSTISPCVFLVQDITSLVIRITNDKYPNRFKYFMNINNKEVTSETFRRCSLKALSRSTNIQCIVSDLPTKVSLPCALFRLVGREGVDNTPTHIISSDAQVKYLVNPNNYDMYTESSVPFLMISDISTLHGDSIIV